MRNNVFSVLFRRFIFRQGAILSWTYYAARCAPYHREVKESIGSIPHSRFHRLESLWLLVFFKIAKQYKEIESFDKFCFFK